MKQTTNIAGDFERVLLTIRDNKEKYQPLPRSLFEVVVELPFKNDAALLHQFRFFPKRLLKGKGKNNSGGLTNEQFWQSITGSIVYTSTLKQDCDYNLFIQYSLLCFTNSYLSSDILSQISERVGHIVKGDYMTGFIPIVDDGIIVDTDALENTSVKNPTSHLHQQFNEEDLKKWETSLRLHRVRFLGGIKAVAADIGVDC